jgi:hypothetical protein
MISFTIIATSDSGLLRGLIFLCAFFCVPAGVGYLAFWRFGRSFRFATLGLGLMTALPSGVAMTMMSFSTPDGLGISLLPLVPLLFGLLLCIISILHKERP